MQTANAASAGATPACMEQVELRRPGPQTVSVVLTLVFHIDTWGLNLFNPQHNTFVSDER